jgi:parallel beta-helix repeat protein
MKRVIILCCIIGGIFAGCDSNSVSDSYNREQSRVGSTKTLDVPGDYPGIQDAVNAAGHGDFIRVAAGSYAEHVQVKSKDLSLRGAGRDQTIIRGSVEFHDSSKVSFEGFTVYGSVHIKNSPGRITGNRILESPQAGLWLEHCFTPIVSDNEIRNNQKEGILLDDSSGIIVSNTIEHNATDGIVINNSSPILENNIVRWNGRDGISIQGFTGYAAPLLNSNASHNNGGESNYDIICFGDSTNPTGRGNAFDDCINCSECIHFDERVTYQE